MRTAKPQIMSRLHEGDPWQPAKISEMMLEFAAPLLDLDDAPRTAELVRPVMQIASLCWNARLYEELGDDQFMRALDALLASAPPDLRAGIERMLDDRRTRFADVPFAVLADVAGENAEEIRVTATAYVPPGSSETLWPGPRTRPERSGAAKKSSVRVPSLPGGMMPFDLVFPHVAEEETRSIHVTKDADTALPVGAYLFREYYCTEPRCDCRRVILHVMDIERRRVAASINYAFEPPKSSSDGPQISLDPLNPQSEVSSLLLSLFEAMIERDPLYRARLVKHYTMWKHAVDDPNHPDHDKLRSAYHDDPSFVPAFPRREAARRASTKQGANDPCACGSGKKYKRCCRSRPGATA
jgi:hypothetical protein